VLILLTNDDGIYAPGLAAMERELRSLGEVCVVAPATEQSGVGHSVTFLQPLVCKAIYEQPPGGGPPDRDRLRGHACEGSPADCVKLGIFEFCGGKPDLVVSGINGGLNAGINVLYSGTVAAAIEGAFFGVTSIAVSLEFDEHAPFERAAQRAGGIIRQILRRNPPAGSLFNLNMPTAAFAPEAKPELRVVPMGVGRYGEKFIRRTDPRGRTYYWATSDPPPPATEHQTDLNSLQAGHVTLTPLQFDMTVHDRLAEMARWELSLDPSSDTK
jgi:5'-nucleotidase